MRMGRGVWCFDREVGIGACLNERWKISDFGWPCLLYPCPTWRISVSFLVDNVILLVQSNQVTNFPGGVSILHCWHFVCGVRLLCLSGPEGYYGLGSLDRAQLIKYHFWPSLNYQCMWEICQQVFVCYEIYRVPLKKVTTSIQPYKNFNMFFINTADRNYWFSVSELSQ